MAALQLSLTDGTYSNFPYVKMESSFQSITILLKRIVHRVFRVVIGLFSTYHLIIHLSSFEMNMPAYKNKLVCK